MKFKRNGKKNSFLLHTVFLTHFLQYKVIELLSDNSQSDEEVSEAKGKAVATVQVLSDNSDNEEEVPEASIQQPYANESFYSFSARQQAKAYLNAGMNDEEAMARAISNSYWTAPKREISLVDTVAEKDITSKKVKSSPSKSKSAGANNISGPSVITAVKKANMKVTSPRKVNAGLLREAKTKRFVAKYESEYGYLNSKVMDQTFGTVGNMDNKEKICRFFYVIKQFQIATRDHIEAVQKEVGEKYEFLFSQRHAFLMSIVSLWKYPDPLPLTSDGLQRNVAGIGHGTADVISKILDVDRFGVMFEKLPIRLESYRPNQEIIKNGKPCLVIKTVVWDEFLWQHNWGVEK